MKSSLLAWCERHKVDLGNALCFGFLFLGLLGITLAKSVEQRAVLTSLLLNLTAVAFIGAVAIAAVLAILVFARRTPGAKGYLAFASMLVMCVFLAMAGLGAGATVLRLESGLRLQVGNDFVFVGGSIPRDLASRLEAVVHPSAPITRVILSSNGGSVQGAIDSAEWLKARGVTRAVIEGDCESACAFLALLLPERYLADGAALGFHDVWGEASRDLAATRTDLLARMDANRIDTAYLRPLMSSSQIQHPSRADLLAHRIVTGCWSQSARAPTKCLAAGEHP